MSVTYRRLSDADEAAVIAWWAAAFDDHPAIISAAFRSDPERFTRSYVAQTADGALCAAITYWVRLIRDASGQPRRVAHIWGVGTPADAANAERRQQADTLIDWALNAARLE